jgi:hypothetical protein
VNPSQEVPLSYETKLNTSVAPALFVIVGAVPPGHLTELGQDTVAVVAPPPVPGNFIIIVAVNTRRGLVVGQFANETVCNADDCMFTTNDCALL